MTAEMTPLFKLMKVPVDSLIVDPSYQPPINPKRVKDIVRAFSIDLLQTITVNIRTLPRQIGTSVSGGMNWEYLTPDQQYILLCDHYLHVIDGQHRVAAAKSLGLKWLYAWVATGLSVAEEAAMFHKLATQRRGSLPVIAQYHANLVAREPLNLAIQHALDKHHLKVGKTNINSIASVSSLMWIWTKLGPDTFKSSLRVIASAYPIDKGRWIVPLLESVALLISQYPKVSLKRLIEKLEVVPTRIIIAEIKNHNEAVNGRMQSQGHRTRQEYDRIESGVEILRRHYNHKLRSGKLEKETL